MPRVNGGSLETAGLAGSDLPAAGPRVVRSAIGILKDHERSADRCK